MIPEVFPGVSLQRSLVAAYELRSEVPVPSGVLALVRVKGKHLRRFEHVVGLLQVVQVGEVKLLRLLGRRVRIVRLRVGLRRLVVVNLHEEGDGDRLEMRTRTLLVDSVLLQVQHISHV